MESVPPAIFILSHMGLGDHLVILPIYRQFAQTHNLIVPVKFHNVPSVQWMVRGLPVALLGVKDDQGAIRLAEVAQRRGEVLRLGMFGKGFDEKRWSEVMYEQAGLPFEDRWNKWHVERDLSREFEPPKEPYVFIHEDLDRGFEIIEKRLLDIPIELKVFFVKKGETDNIFNYCRLIEEATELHLIDSCFAILADSLPTLKAKRKVIHLYSRPNALPPTYKQEWTILR